MKSTWPSRLALVVSLLMLGAGTRTVRTAASEAFLEGQEYASVYYLPRRELLPAMSLGYAEAAASLIWLKALVYVGDELANESGADDFYSYAHAIIELDPSFCEAYDWGTTAGTYRARAVTVEELYQALEIARLGYERCTSGDSAWALAALILYRVLPAMSHDDVSTVHGESPEELRTEGEIAMAYAVRNGATPEWQSVTNAIQLTELGQSALALEQLQQMYALANNDETRGQIATLLREAQASTFVAQVEAERQQMNADWEAELPWVDFDLYQFVWRPAEPVLSPSDGFDGPLQTPHYIQ